MTDQTETLRAALQEAHRVLSALDAQAQADPPAPDHFVKVTVGAWRDGIRPVIGLIREALDTPPAAGLDVERVPSALRATWPTRYAASASWTLDIEDAERFISAYAEASGD